MTSFFHENLMLSIQVPIGWSGHDVPDADQFRILGPAHSEHDDYQSTMSYLRATPEGFGDEWLDEFSRNSVEQLAADHPGFEMTGQDRFTLSSMAPVAMTTFAWHHSESGLSFAQMQALIMASPFVLYVVNAATLLPLDTTYAPIFNAVLRSTRIMTPRG